VHTAYEGIREAVWLTKLIEEMGEFSFMHWERSNVIFSWIYLKTIRPQLLLIEAPLLRVELCTLNPNYTGSVTWLTRVSLSWRILGH
jgi:hypothetical protein